MNYVEFWNIADPRAGEDIEEDSNNPICDLKCTPRFLDALKSQSRIKK